MSYPAHIRPRADGKAEGQPLPAHLENTARYAARAAGGRLEKTALLAGWLHDMGKATATFADYITRAFAGEPVRRGSVNHTFAGARYALERWHTPGEESFQNLTAELLAVTVGAHHGLFDLIDPNGADGFARRLGKEGIGYDEARKNALREGIDEATLQGLFEDAVREIIDAARLCESVSGSIEEMRFHLSLLARLLLSALMDGDRRDTAEFMSGAPLPVPPDMTGRWPSLLDRLEAQLEALPVDTEINRARRAFSQQCRDAAERKNGLCRLSLPTGGGKTLASLRFALAAAQRYRKKRIVFVIPLLSVLEQNAEVLREALGDDGLILEHHSNLVREVEREETAETALLQETWDAPVVITTLVQLLNTLFAGQTGCIRRMQALADSIIVIDEVQSVPRRMISLFNLAMNFLAYVCNTTVVLCSATQPGFEEATHPLRLPDAPHLVPYDPALWRVFRRTEIRDRRRPEGYTIEELSAFALDCAEQEGSTLLIANTKAEALNLWRIIKERAACPVFHLSTALCMAHRIETLRQINALLKSGQPVVCVSTQLVEAGIDFSFGCVVRVLAGLDNVIQAAGRCNRNGERDSLCPVYIVNLQNENLRFLKEIGQAQHACEAVLLRFAADTAVLDGDLTSDKSVQAYYKSLYTNLPRGAMDYAVSAFDTSLYELLSDNAALGHHCATYGQHMLAQAFQTAGASFRVFDDDTRDVLTPYGEGAALIAGLAGARARYDLLYRKSLLTRAKPYAISLYAYELKALGEAGGVYNLCEDTIAALRSEFYDQETGFRREGGQHSFLEV